MKNLIYFLGFIAISSTWSCKTTKNSNVDNDPNEEEVIDVPIAQDAEVLGTMAITQFVYYTIEKSDGKEKFVEQSVLGDGVFETKNGEERLTIIENGTDRQINCKQMMHPKLKTEVFVDIGDETDVREH